MPYIAAIGMLLAAPTMRARWLPFSFAACLLALAIEGWLSPWTAPDQQAIATAALFTMLVFVVASLHVRGLESAFTIAETEEQARAAALESERLYVDAHGKRHRLPGQRR